MKARDIRRIFLSYYAERDHRVVPAAPLIPKDPTLLFTIAGMVPFKPYLLGEEPPPFPRAASVQKCFRTENIEDVGTNAKDCTFFEMLGNFSFGDYFKRDACPWAWELLTGPFGIDPARIWITVFEDDDETAEIWEKHVGVDGSRILRFPKEDNFWQMGVAGPCGPCSELYVDRGPEFGPEGRPTRFDEPRNERYQEIYNLVFMQYVQDEPFHVVGSLEKPSIDTGMGLERLAQILQDAATVWDTDLLKPLVDHAASITGIGDPRTLDIAADHSRSAAFLIGDGVAPSNDGRGYILRRVIRRALTEVRIGGYAGDLLVPMATKTVEEYGDSYPELERNRQGILETLRREEQRFSQTLDLGLEILEQAVAKADGTLPGDVAFRLHDTYGFPLDITQDVAERAGLGVDVAGFERLMTEQKTRSRAVTEGEKKRVGPQLKLDVTPTEFLGYDRREAEVRVVAIVRDVEAVESAAAGNEVDVVVDRTPFYPEGGGQIGDRGVIVGATARGDVLDTQTVGAAVLHRVRVTDGELQVGMEVEMQVDPAHRTGAEQAHTATHMLHHTLRNVLGDHVRQMGSLVEPGRLRFDFSHFSAVTADSLSEIEEVVNRRVSSDDEVRAERMAYDQAISMGALAFFEEKYGDEVRVVRVGDYSYELCGGTHVEHTGRVGFVKLLGEGSIGSNIRRVEALTGTEGLRWVNARLREAERAAELVRSTPDELVAGIERLLKTQKELEREMAARERSGIGAAVAELVPTASQSGSAKLVVARRPEAVGVLRDLAVAVRDKLGRGAVILGTTGEGKVNLVAAVTKDLGVDAREILRSAAEHIGGGAGGKPDLATAGGRLPEGLDEALAVARRAAEGALAQ